MKFVKLFLSACIIYAGFILCTSPASSCTKKQIIHDSTTVHDTTIIRDTIIDTVGCCNINEGMVAYYTFTGGSLKDSSGNNNDIIFNNATKTTDRFGNSNGAYLFDGSTSYMQVKNSASLNPANITLMAVVKLNGFYSGPCHGNQILMKGPRDQSQGIYGLRVINSTIDCNDPLDTTKENVTGNYGDYPQTASVQDTSFAGTGQWMTIIFTYDGYESKLYVNGRLKNVTVGTGIFTSNMNDIFIGHADNVVDPYWWNGVIDEIRIYNKALCPSAVNQLSNSQRQL